MADHNEFIITTPSQEIDFVCLHREGQRHRDGLRVVLSFLLQVYQETAVDCLILYLRALLMLLVSSDMQEAPTTGAAPSGADNKKPPAGAASKMAKKAWMA
ncbi:hypothetical protein HID58_086005 [Brassica napus]|uniref:Uncharacterized protein n=1 Tax=Brassica napus TaxID=3708 RepID=A0ABQ7XQK7_BRANA|nr:hypothetical protein HID58_086005 [Brassica napus]